MGVNDRRETYFRKTLKAERQRRGWSQKALATMLSDRGIPAHLTTVAKLETGDRFVRVDEAAAIADLFDVSVDTLLGRRKRPKGDQLQALKQLVHTVGQAAFQVSALESSVREHADDLAALGDLGGVAAQCEHATAALADAQQALTDLTDYANERFAGSTIARHTRRLLITALQQEEAEDDAQS